MVDRYFNHWISLPTWDSMHPMDMARFYQFVKALRTYSRNSWRDKFHQNVLAAAKEKHQGIDESYTRDMIEFFFNRAEAVLAFESVLFPDPVVEMRNPSVVLAYLRQFHQVVDEKGNTRPLYTPEQLEDMLEENFGKDWKNKRIAIEKGKLERRIKKSSNAKQKAG